MINIPIGESIETEDETDRKDKLKDSIGFCVFSSALARFMPTNSAIMFERDTIQIYLDHMGIDYTGLEDEVEDLILMNTYDEEEEMASIVAIRTETFFENFNLDDDVSREYVESLLRSGNTIRLNMPTDETEDDEGDDGYE